MRCARSPCRRVRSASCLRAYLEPPLDWRESIAMLMMVLWREPMTFRNANFVTATGAAINSRIGSFRARISVLVEVCMVEMVEQIAVLIVSHVYLS